MSNSHTQDILEIARCAREVQADYIIGHTHGTWYYLLALKFLTRSKIILEIHSLAEEEGRMYGTLVGLRYYLYRFAYSVTYRMCDMVVVLSETLAGEIRRYNANVAVVWGGYDERIFKPSEPDPLVAQAHKILVGYAGNNRIWQGLTFLLDAFEKLRHKDDTYALSLLISEPRVPDTHVAAIYGPRAYEQVPSFLAACDILVIPRLDNRVNKYTFPSKLLEYMAMGKPVVVSRTSDMHKIVQDGISGLTYEPGNTQELISCLLSLKDVQLRERLGDGARCRARAYTWQSQVDALLDALR